MSFDFESLMNSFGKEVEKKVEGVKSACRKHCRQLSDYELERYRDRLDPSNPCYDIATEELNRRRKY